jgi:hypothetical protein
MVKKVRCCLRRRRCSQHSQFAAGAATRPGGGNMARLDSLITGVRMCDLGAGGRIMSFVVSCFAIGCLLWREREAVRARRRPLTRPKVPRCCCLRGGFLFAPAHITAVSPWKAGAGGVTPWLDMEGTENPTSHLDHRARHREWLAPSLPRKCPPLTVFNLQGPKVRVSFWKHTVGTIPRPSACNYLCVRQQLSTC